MNRLGPVLFLFPTCLAINLLMLYHMVEVDMFVDLSLSLTRTMLESISGNELQARHESE